VPLWLHCVCRTCPVACLEPVFVRVCVCCVCVCCVCGVFFGSPFPSAPRKSTSALLQPHRCAFDIAARCQKCGVDGVFRFSKFCEPLVDITCAAWLSGPSVVSVSHLVCVASGFTITHYHPPFQTPFQNQGNPAFGPCCLSIHTTSATQATAQNKSTSEFASWSQSCQSIKIMKLAPKLVTQRMPILPLCCAVRQTTGPVAATQTLRCAHSPCQCCRESTTSVCAL